MPMEQSPSSDLRRVVVSTNPELTGDELPGEALTINMGPSHPAMHGTVRIMLTVEGETIRDADVQVGYLHRGFEKEAENACWTQVFPYTDRLNYVSPMMNNVGYAMAVEKLLGVADRVPERARYIRVIVSEMARVVDHMVCIAASGMEMGAFTPFLWLVQAREGFFDLFEELCGARVTHSYVRVGGVKHDLPEGWLDRLRAAVPRVETCMADTETMLTRNAIFRGRTVDVSTVSPEFAKAWGWTGPCLRSTGVAYDVRKDHPYLVYDRFDFEVPVGSKGDNYDRYLVRLEEIRQSLKIIEQAVEQLPGGPVIVDDPRVALVPPLTAYDSIEGMIGHFKMLFDGIKVPAGEAYHYIEAANGELGFYLVSDGSGRPYKCRVRPPCFQLVSSLGEVVRGRFLADIVPTFDLMNMIGGECDR
ncbi:MAG TPA: NADH-quinone oxidoreductase subunit D [Polyangia bacterium]|jgi:NADH-quinone oxidoreductase subunit D